eukprot:COSAG04_NODE_4155_length_2266_cov_1.691278_1_plen_20_part_10
MPESAENVTVSALCQAHKQQ